MRLTCEKCGGPIPRQVGSGGRRKFCPACSPSRDRPDRVKARRTPPVQRKPSATLHQVSSATSVYAATKLELETAGVIESVMGQCALVLARHIDADEENGSGLASLVRAHREALAAAMAAAPPAETTLSRLRRSRGLPD